MQFSLFCLKNSLLGAFFGERDGSGVGASPLLAATNVCFGAAMGYNPTILGSNTYKGAWHCQLFDNFYIQLSIYHNRNDCLCCSKNPSAATVALEIHRDPCIKKFSYCQSPKDTLFYGGIGLLLDGFVICDG
jgi:hypothetical protein